MAPWRIAAASLLALASSAVAQRTEPEAAEAATPGQIDQIALERDRFERLTVPVKIDGAGPYRFFIDTGAQATVVTRRVTEQLKIPTTGSARLIAMGSSRMVDTVELESLEFANRNILALTAPLLESEHVGADGILGLDMLQDLRVLIDFREQSMHVADARTLGGNNGYEIVVKARRKLGQMIITDAYIDGVRTSILIDTGAQNSLGNTALLERLRAREHSTVISTDVLGAQIASTILLARRVSIGDMDMNRVPIGFADSPVFEALGLDKQPALILGMANLRMFERVAIDFSSQKVLFDLPASSMMTPYQQLHHTTPSSRS